MMPALGMVVIFIEFLVMHWHFIPVLNASMLTAQAAMRVYMFHSYQFRAPVMNLFFHPHEPYNDITLNDVHHLSILRGTLPMVSLTSTPG